MTSYFRFPWITVMAALVIGGIVLSGRGIQVILALQSKEPVIDQPPVGKRSKLKYCSLYRELQTWSARSIDRPKDRSDTIK